MTENTVVDQIISKWRNNPKYFIETQLYIKTKARKRKLLLLNEVQYRVFNIIQKIRSEDRPVRLIILKARQTGISTLTEALIFHDTALNKNVTSFIIAHDKESTNHLFNMFKLYLDNMERELRPKRQLENKIELLFENPNKKTKDDDPGLGSRIRVDTAGNPNAGRSLTIHNLHISELAFWENAEDVMKGLMGAVDDTATETMVIVESTANGIGNYYHQLWKDAEAGLNEYTPVFIPWFELKSYRKEPPEDFVPFDYDHEIYGNEAKLAERFSLDISQIYWRRYTIRNKFNNDIKGFQQEFPTTPEEAFLISGRCVFNVNLIKKYYEFTSEPKRGDLDISDDYKSFKAGIGSNLRLWKEPERDNRYSIGVDVAEGFATGDYSAAEVFDKKNYEQVAEWHGHIEQSNFAYVLKNLAKFYNDAIVVVESNQGQVVIDSLKKIYYRLYKRRQIGRREEHMTEELGFRTTGKTKDILISDFKKLFEADPSDLILNGKDLLYEMSTFVEEEPDPKKNQRKLSTGAEGKNFDDRVIAACLAIQGLKETYLNTNTDKELPKHKYSNPYTRY